MMHLPIFALVLSLAASPVFAQVYRYIDEQGNTVFTDQPPETVESQTVDLPTLNSLPAPDVRNTDNSAQQENPATGQPYQQLDLLLPDQAAIRANDGNISIAVSLAPRLATQHQLQLLVDGQPYGAPVNGLVLQANNLDRGEHSLAVQVIGPNGVVQQSDNYTIHIQRVHINAAGKR